MSNPQLLSSRISEFSVQKIKYEEVNYNMCWVTVMEIWSWMNWINLNVILSKGLTNLFTIPISVCEGQKDYYYYLIIICNGISWPYGGINIKTHLADLDLLKSFFKAFNIKYLKVISPNNPLCSKNAPDELNQLMNKYIYIEYLFCTMHSTRVGYPF